MEAGITSLVFVAIFGVAFAIAFGIYIGKKRLKQDETQGVIYVYVSKPNEQPSLLLEYAVPIDDIMARKRVIFDVKIVR